MASLNRIEANKPAGADGTAAEFYKWAGDILALPLTALFNHVMLTGLYPKTSYRTIIVKYYYPDDWQNFRWYLEQSFAIC